MGCLPHQCHPAKDPLGDWVLIIDDIHEGSFTGLQDSTRLLSLHECRQLQILVCLKSADRAVEGCNRP